MARKLYVTVIGQSSIGVSGLLTVDLVTGAFSIQPIYYGVTPATYSSALGCVVGYDFLFERTLCINPVTGTNTTVIPTPIPWGDDIAPSSWTVTSDGVSSKGSLFVVTSDPQHVNYQLVMYVHTHTSCLCFVCTSISMCC
jgi:hypothetical protein